MPFAIELTLSLLKHSLDTALAFIRQYIPARSLCSSLAATRVPLHSLLQTGSLVHYPSEPLTLLINVCTGWGALHAGEIAQH